MAVTATLAATSQLPSSTSASFLSALKDSATNATSAHLSNLSAKDIVYLPLRGIAELDNLVVRRIPDFILGQSRTLVTAVGGSIASLLGAGGNNAGMADLGQAAAANAGAGIAGIGWKAMVAEAFQASTFKSYFGMIHYLTSRWSFTCFLLALILNRVQIYASTRQRIFLSWDKRLALRLIPILLFASQIYNLLQAIRCQSSPEFSLYRHGDMDKYSLLDWAPEGGFLHAMSSTLLYRSSDEAACAAVRMSRPSPEVRAPRGSFSLLWPTFIRLSLSHLIETISCHLQQLPVMTEMGMSVFEHSLAFAEAETTISYALGRGLFGSSRASSNASASSATTIPASGTLLALSDATKSLVGPHLLDRINVPVEVLFVALLSCCNAVTSNLISVFNAQKSLRLINTGFWGICFISAFVWGFFSTSIMVRVDSNGNSEDMRTVSGLLHFPTVAIIGFMPHIIILLGMVICGLIYCLALTFTALSLHSNSSLRRPTGLLDRLKIAHENLQVAIQVRGINIRWHEDFYTALLRVGFAALTAASEAVFLNEGRSVEMRQFTWLEEERLDEIEASRVKDAASERAYFQIAEEYGLPAASPGSEDRGGKWQSGYAKERKTETEKEKGMNGAASIVYPNPRTGGVGALQRTTRFYLLFIYMRGIIFLMGGYIAFGIGAFLDRIGITTRPGWLRNIIGRSLKQAQSERERMNGRNNDGTQELDFWFLAADGKASVPRTPDTDIEPEMRRRLALEHSGQHLEEVLDQKMYEWWKGNGWYGLKDGSGSYQPSHADDFDTTSVISMSTASVTDDEQAWESESDGRRTPTQRSPAPSVSAYSLRRSRSPTPAFHVQDTPLDPKTLARLLNPQDRASREEARMLAAHLAASSTASSDNRIMTRSRYRHELETERSRVLLAGRRPVSVPLYPSSTAGAVEGPLTPAEEAEVLETLIISRRQRKTANAETPDLSTPPCVVCQSSPRTIIAWPCRCLCVCEDCRVNLALNNFGNCVTCRRGVGGFVRLWVP